MKICSTCHSPNRDEANFCGVCGTHMSPPPPPPPPPVSRGLSCTACGAENEEGANFCETCGAFLKQLQAGTSAGASAAPSGTPPHDHGGVLPPATPSVDSSAPDAIEPDEAVTVIGPSDVGATENGSSDVGTTEIGPSGSDLTVVDSSDSDLTVVDSSDV